MTHPFAHQTAARLAAAVVPEEPLTPMERAIVRQHILSLPPEERHYVHFVTVPRPTVAWWREPRLPLREGRTVKIERCLYYCPQCVRVTPDAFGFKHRHGGELFWASVDGQLDGGPECPTCMAPYWEAWRRVIYEIAEYGVAVSRREAREIKERFNSLYSIEVIMMTLRWTTWNPR